MYKVFYLSKEIIFIKSNNEIVVSSSDVIIEVKNMDVLSVAYQAFINEDGIGKLIFVCFKNMNEVFKKFTSLFKNIEAAGGLVKNERNELLMIFRLGKWDLPKGKIESDESPEMAAMREVNEETGMNSLQIVQALESTYHIYYVSNKKFLKTTYWYEMDCRDQKIPTPQTAEGITMVEWLGESGVRTAMKNTYDSLLVLIELYLKQ